MPTPLPQTILRLRDNDGLTWEAIGDRYGASEATARRWYQRARDGVPMAGRRRGRPPVEPRPCSGCGERSARARGLCGRCYQRARRA